MVPYYGDFDTTETIKIPFNTFDSNDPTASVTITNLAAADIEIHKDGGTTQRSSDSGVTVTIDFDGVTGNHLVSIDLSDNTDAGFYADGSIYQVRMEGTTVDAGTINAWIASFSIGRMLRPTTNGRKLDVTANGNAGIDWANIENPTTAVELSGTDIKLVDTATSVTNGVTASTVSDKTGYALSAAGVQAIWDALTSALTTVGSIGKKLADWVLGSDNKTLLSTDAQTGVTIPTVTTNTDMRGTDGANTTVPDAAGTAAGLHATTDGKIDVVDSNVDDIVAKLPTNFIMGSSDQADHDGDFNTIVDNPWPIPSCPAVMERPESGSETFQIVLAFHSAVDAAPTIAAENSAGTSRNANLSATTMVASSDILYSVTYTVDTEHAIEGLKFTITYADGGTTRRVILSSMVRDENVVAFRKNVAKNNFTFLMVNSTDHITGETGLTVTAERSIDGAAFGACANAVTEVANGVYKINLAAADLNGDTIMLKFTASGADARFISIVTVS